MLTAESYPVQLMTSITMKCFAFSAPSLEWADARTRASEMSWRRSCSHGISLHLCIIAETIENLCMVQFSLLLCMNSAVSHSFSIFAVGCGTINLNVRADALARQRPTFPLRCVSFQGATHLEKCGDDDTRRPRNGERREGDCSARDRRE